MKKMLWSACLCAGLGTVSAQTCPPAGARYIIKDPIWTTGVTALGAPPDRNQSCKWRTDDGRELWWRMGSDVVPAGPAPSTAPPAGRLAAGSVFTCTLPGIGQFSGAYFGIVDGSTYQDFDRRRGSYRYDEATGVLRMVSGSARGMAYRRMPEGNFRVLDEAGKLTGGNCVHNPRLTLDSRW